MSAEVVLLAGRELHSPLADPRAAHRTQRHSPAQRPCIYTDPISNVVDRRSHTSSQSIVRVTVRELLVWPLALHRRPTDFKETPAPEPDSSIRPRSLPELPAASAARSPPRDVRRRRL